MLDVSQPRFPAKSTKRGMARAVEIVEWMRDYAKAREQESQPGSLVRSVWHEKALVFDEVVHTLRIEAR